VSHVRRTSVAALISVLILGVAFLPDAASARSRSQIRYLAAAHKGVKQTHRWWSRGRH
jgi:hypothetical protein